MEKKQVAPLEAEIVITAASNSRGAGVGGGGGAVSHRHTQFGRESRAQKMRLQRSAGGTVQAGEGATERKKWRFIDEKVGVRRKRHLCLEFQPEKRVLIPRGEGCGFPRTDKGHEFQVRAHKGSLARDREKHLHTDPSQGTEEILQEAGGKRQKDPRGKLMERTLPLPSNRGQEQGCKSIQ